MGTVDLLEDSAQLSIENGGALQVATDAINSGTLGVDDDNNATGSSLTVTGGLTNSGTLNVDSGNGSGSGSVLTVTGTLTNSNTLNFGNGNLSADSTISVGDFDNTGSLNIAGDYNSGTAKATFDAGSAVAPTTLDSSISIVGVAELDYGSGAITAIGSDGNLTIHNAAQIDVTGRSGNDSALALTSNAGGLYLDYGEALAVAGPFTNSGTLGVDDGNGATGSSLTVTGGLTNSGTLNVDSGNGSGSGSVLTVTGTLTNSNTLNFGNGNLSADSTISVGDFDNTGSLNIAGDYNSGTAKATFDAGSAVAPTTLDSSISIVGVAELDYGSGAITAIGSDGNLAIHNAAQIDVTGRSGTDSALALTSNAGGLYLDYGEAFTVAGPFTNSGTLGVDDGNGATGSSLTVTGGLTNSGTLDVDSGNGSGSGSVLTVTGTLTNSNTLNFGNGNLSADSTISVSEFDNTGSLNIAGDYNSGTAKATFDAGAAVAPTTLDSSISIVGVAELDYGSGAITAIGSDGNLTIHNAAQIDVTGRSGNDSALALTSNAGGLYLDYGEALAVAGPFTNSGTLGVDDGNGATGSSLTVTGGLTNSGTLNVDSGNGSGSGSVLTVTGTLTNSNTLNFGNGNLSADSTISVGGFDNTGSLSVTGNTTAGTMAKITVSSTATDTGSITLNSGSELEAATLGIKSGGTVTLDGGSIDGAISVASGGTFEGTGSAGSVTVASGGTFAPGADPGIIDTGSISLVAGAKFDIELGGTASGTYDQDDVSGTVSLGGATLDGSLVNGFTPAVGDSFTIISNDGSDPVSGTFAGLAQGASTDIGGDIFTINYAGGDGNDVVLTDTGVACYGRGTMVLTDRGEKPVETVSVGDRLVTAGGERRPVRWTGHRHLDTTKHRDPRAVWPVRVHAGAFGEALPRRDLWMSPGHNVFVGGVLMPVRVLVNGVTVTQEPVETVTYWHVELDSHDVILAEGLPAESYLDTGNRSAFANAGPAIELNPDFEPKHWAETCAPIHKVGPVVEAAKTVLLARTERLGHATTACHDLHLVADGRRIDAFFVHGKRLAFILPADSETAALVSRTFIPCQVKPESTDSRVLGVRVKRLQIDGKDIDLRSDLPESSWHKPEEKDSHVQRWTKGRTALPPRSRLVLVELAGDGRYWREFREGVASQSA